MDKANRVDLVALLGAVFAAVSRVLLVDAVVAVCETENGIGYV